VVVGREGSAGQGVAVTWDTHGGTTVPRKKKINMMIEDARQNTIIVTASGKYRESLRSKSAAVE